MKWTDVDRETKVMQKFMSRANIGNWLKWTEVDLKKFTKSRFRSLIDKHPKLKPYKFKNKLYLLLKVFQARAPLKFHQYKTIVKKEANKVARAFYTENKIHKTHTKTYPIKVINEVAEFLSYGDYKSKATGIILWLTHFTGARVAECLTMRWEDCEIEKNTSGIFLKIDIRCSKTNQIPTHREQLTLMFTESKAKFQMAWKQWETLTRKGPNGFIFDQKWAKTINIQYQLDKVSETFNLNPKLTCHSGRNFTLQQLILADVAEGSIKSFMRWKDNSDMIQSYRNVTLECTMKGAAALLKDFDN